MKRLICLVIAMFVLFGATACADEILFRGIPWGSNAPITFEALSDFDPYDYSGDFPYQGWLEPYAGQGKNNAVNRIAYPKDGVTVAGYDIISIELTFLYGLKDGKVCRDEDAVRLCFANYYLSVADVDRAYDDLYAKLKDLYGKPKKDTSYGDRCVTWKGDSNTGVYLTINSNVLWIGYGITDNAWLKEVNNALSDEDARQAEGNVNGL